MLKLWQQTLYVMLVLALVQVSNANAQTSTQNNSKVDKPNIVFIFADDLGYGDISSFGAKDINTPHIDQLANDGIKFTNFYSAANICTPSRASLLTGRHSVRMGISSVFAEDSPEGMPLSEITIAEALKPQGYKTGLVGKWHLGHNDRFMPWNQGFDEFYGVPYSNDMSSFFWYENQEITYTDIDQQYLTKRYTDKAIDFIDRNQAQPFFLYLAHNMPHVPLYASPDFQGSSERGLYGDVVQELDWSVGEIIKTLKAKGLWENTLLVFTSDNGPWLMMGEDGGSAGELRNGKMQTFEGGHRVPTVAHWPKGIKPRQYDDVVSMLDWFPTFVELSGGTLPNDREIDGRSITGLLSGQSATEEQVYVYFDRTNKEVQALRKGDWKLKLPHGLGINIPTGNGIFAGMGMYSNSLLLIDLSKDPSESENLAEQYPEKVTELKALIANYQAIKPEQRWLFMSGTASDKKGYGGFFTVLGVLALINLLILIAIIYGMNKLIRYGYRRIKSSKQNS
ncbi:MAG TPA: N-acetylgalactosamine-6-sulfatase [Colwellia sp.]|nr:N-acetylgalactosamine-6-sulfatase [Colwellia sp.]|tara:strand:+ start:6066 stop:7592 length:1527 start_codon:yes stop_codon:yes gene_type:complete